MNFMRNMAEMRAPLSLLTRDEILDDAKKLAHERNCSVKLSLAIVQRGLDAEIRYREADLAYSLLNEEMIRGP